MIYPDDFSVLIKDLKIGIKNSDLHSKYGFNKYTGIKGRTNKLTREIDCIIVSWNRTKAIYDNSVDLKTKTLTYIGAGLEDKQKIGRTNSTLINRFDNKTNCPVILVSKIDTMLEYVSLLEPLENGYHLPTKETNYKFEFKFKLSELDIDALSKLLSIPPGKKAPWLENPSVKMQRKKQVVKRIINDDKLRNLIKEMQFVGDLGELVALAYEADRLNSLGLNNYVEKIVHTSVERGHGFGYDIQSHDIDIDTGKIYEIYIEVKSTKLDASTTFEMTKNEYEFYTMNKKQYRIYRVYDVYDNEDNLIVLKFPFDNLIATKKTVTSYVMKVTNVNV